jgi:hypothetical protein
VDPTGLHPPLSELKKSTLMKEKALNNLMMKISYTKASKIIVLLLKVRLAALLNIRKEMQSDNRNYTLTCFIKEV